MAVLFISVAVNGADQKQWVSEKGQFFVSYQSELDPIVINQIHEWTLFITDADGVPVSDAQVSVEGGMPAHNHGLPTAPVIKPGERGQYMLQGLRFHMMGYWKLELNIETEGASDNVVITLDL